MRSVMELDAGQNSITLSEPALHQDPAGAVSESKSAFAQ